VAVGDSGENIGEIGFRIDAVQFGSLQDRGKRPVLGVL
jgi:hypothetical protein